MSCARRALQPVRLCPAQVAPPVFDKIRFHRLVNISSVRCGSTYSPPALGSSHQRSPLNFISNSPRFTKRSDYAPNHHFGGGERDTIDDTEWELRVGRAISILTTTLPDFFKTGLITRFDSGTTHSPFAFVEAVHPSPDLIYARNIRLRYEPPERLPSPFPEVLQIEGLPLYFASAAIVRTSLNTLYRDMHVALKTVEISSQGPRERQIKIGFIVAGLSRVGDSKAEWDIMSTYKFSETSGLISQHDVNSIHPPPHVTVYDALRSSLQKLGLMPPRPGPVPRVDVGECAGRTQN